MKNRCFDFVNLQNGDLFRGLKTSDDPITSNPVDVSTSDESVNSVSSAVSTDRTLAFGLLNANSVGSKYTAICDEINDRKLDICLLTETHHSSTRDTSLRRCVPDNYSLHDAPRQSEGANGRSYGGVAAIIGSNLKYHQIKSSSQATTFESLAFTVVGLHVVCTLRLTWGIMQGIIVIFI